MAREPGHFANTDPGSDPTLKPGEPAAAADLPLAPGVSVGRCVVRALLGSGGMGVVYTAWDPDLEREVALKLLRSGNGSGPDASGATARLLREAQSMAQLSHP